MNFYRRHFPTLVGLIIVLSWQYLTAWLIPSIPLLQTNPYLSHIGPWLTAILLILLILFWERQSLNSIGMRRISWKDVTWGLTGFIIGLLVFIITTPIIRALHLTTVGGTITQQMNQVPVPVSLFIAFTAGVTEEILYRGYLIERLISLTGSLTWGTIIALVAFALMHLSFWGLGGLIQIGAWSVVITLLYVRRRNLYATMLMHFLNDTFALVLAPLLFARFLR